MPCPTCGDSQTQHIREIWDNLRTMVAHIESLSEAKATLRTFFSPGDEWTDTDDRIGNAMCDLDAVIFSLVEIAGQHKEAHKAAVAAYEALKTEAEAIDQEVERLDAKAETTETD